MTLRHMKIFVIVCQSGSITAASKRLYISQPAISNAVKELETYYGVKLFDRISKKIYLTDIGQTILDYALHITSLFEELETTVQNADKIGTLRIGASITIGTHMIPGFVKEFSMKNPDIQPFITINNSDMIEHMILDNQLDIALVEGIVHSTDLVTRQLSNDDLVIICSNENILLNGKFLSTDDLISQKFLMREKNSGTREIAESILMIHGISVIPCLESASTNAIINAVSLDLGISILPRKLVQKEVDNGVISILTIPELNLIRNYYLIYHKNKYLAKSAKAFIDLVLNHQY